MRPDLARIRRIATEVVAASPWIANCGSVIDADGCVLFHAFAMGSEELVAALDRDTVLALLDRIEALEDGLVLASQVIASVEQCRAADAIYNNDDIEHSKTRLRKLVEDAEPSRNLLGHSR